jgi:Surface antigen variable number repeat
MLAAFRVVSPSWLVVAALGCGGASPPPVQARAPSPVAAPAPDPSHSTTLVCADGPRRVTVELAGAHHQSAAAIFPMLRVFEVCDGDVWGHAQAVIVAYYYDHGYPAIRVEPVHLSVSADGSVIDARFNIQEGLLFRVGRFRAHEQRGGQRHPPMGAFRPSLRPQDVFNRTLVSRDVDGLRHTYADAGYAHVEAEPTIELHFDSATIDIDIDIVRGELVHYRNIRFEGIERLDAARLLEQIRLSAGDRYSESKLLRAKEILSATGEFRRVDIVSHDADTPGLIDITFDVEELPGPAEA